MSAPARWLSKDSFFIIAIIISGGFITILNQTILSPALPSIMREFGITASLGQWLTTGFMLVNGIMVPITAYLIDRFSTRALFLTSMSVFCLGTILAGFAPTFSLLLLARILQAFGAGIQMPLGSVTMMRLFPVEKRGIAMGLVGIVIAFAPAIGPTFSGWVVDQWSWHYIFRCLIPLVVVDILFAFFFLKNVGEPVPSRLDWPSVALSTVAFGGLLYGFSEASGGWLRVMTLAPLAIGAVGLVFFIRRQNHLEAPLLNLKALRSPIFSCATILSMINNCALIAGTLIFPIYLQDVLGYGAMQSGLLMLPGAILMGIMSPITGMLFDRFGPRVLAITGFTLMTVTTGCFCFLTTGRSFLTLCLLFTIRELGMSMANMPINTWGINALSYDLIAHGNAINNTARQVAGSIGTAIMVTVMTMVTNSRLSVGAPAEATLAGINAAFTVATLLSAIALVLTLLKVHQQQARRQA